MSYQIEMSILRDRQRQKDIKTLEARMAMEKATKQGFRSGPGTTPAPGTKPGVTPADPEDPEDQEFDKDGNPLPMPEDMSDEQADEELEQAKQQWQSLIRAEIRNTGCNHTKAMSTVGKRNPQLRNRMISLANRPRQLARSRSRSRR